MVNICLHRHRWTRVYLQEPRLELFVEHDIEAQDLHATLQIGYQGTQIDASKLNYQLDLRPHHVKVVALATEVRLELREGPL